MQKRLIIVTMAACAAFAPSHAENLVILHTNDTHSQIDPADDGLGGIARRKVLIDSVRTVHGNRTILVDAGDAVQGTLFFNIYKGEVEEKAMNALGYDIRILGNHEFDNGLEQLASNLATSDAELLTSNYQTIGTPLEGLFIPYTIRMVDGKRIAFMPVNIQPKGLIADRNVTGMGYVDALETANHLAWYLKNIEQADAVIALTHIGYKEGDKPDDIKIARSSRDIDVIIGGHSHTTIDPSDPDSPAYLVKNADGRDVVVAQTGRYGKYLGEITLDLDNLQATPQYKLLRVDSRLDDRIDPNMDALIKPYREAVDYLNNKKVAKTSRHLDRESDDLLNFAADFVAMRGRQLADDVDFAIVNKGGLRNSLPKGDITEGQLITLMPFFNRVQVIDLPGDSLASAFDTMARAGGNGVSAEVAAEYDPQTQRCTSIIIDGSELDPHRTYRIATIDYLANGGDYMHGLTDHNLVAESPVYLFEDMIEYFNNGKGHGKTINPSSKKRMRPTK